MLMLRYPKALLAVGVAALCLLVSADARGAVLGRHVLTPACFEEIYGLTTGNTFHGDMATDQLFSIRPLFGCPRYRTPVRNLYLCGAGAHPGGGVMGAAGHNAAHEILTDFKRGRVA